MRHFSFVRRLLRASIAFVGLAIVVGLASPVSAADIYVYLCQMG